ncbi:MAG: hypothetical protein JRC77_04680 [Deltaproteobacteria bacterium]|nr:hypothetical protein [Deltaproteobacteria bacterium]
MFGERIEVECYSGYRANERPLAFSLRGKRFEVEEVVDRWYEGGLPGRPELLTFKIRTCEGHLYLLRYNALFDAWSTISAKPLAD